MVAVQTEYDVRYGPLTVLELTARTEINGSAYRSSLDMRTVGVVGYLFPWQAHTATHGRLTGAVAQPRLHHSRGEYRGQRRSVRIEYTEDGVVSATILPAAELDYREVVAVDLQQGTIDPLSATVGALRSNCRGTLRVFDGRRRYDLAFTDHGDAAVPSARGALYRGRAQRCEGAILPVAGFWRPDQKHDERPSRLEYWIASPGPDMPRMPVYMELSSERGTLSVHLTAVRRPATIESAP